MQVCDWILVLHIGEFPLEHGRVEYFDKVHDQKVGTDVLSPADLVVTLSLLTGRRGRKGLVRRVVGSCRVFLRNYLPMIADWFRFFMLLKLGFC